MASELILILGDQLFDGLPGMPTGVPVWMREDVGLCTRTRHHQQKLVLFLSAMRHFAEALRENKREVHYQELAEGEYVDALGKALKDNKTAVLHAYRPSDRFLLPQLEQLCALTGTELRLYDSPGFLTCGADWQAYRSQYRRLFMADFYAYQRKRLGVLVTEKGGPVGGQWSFDPENRKSLPKTLDVPEPWFIPPDSTTMGVMQLVADRFPDHPGQAAGFRYPVTHTEAVEWLELFISQRLRQFGPYEDALSLRHSVLFHSLLTPMLNTGLLTPALVLESVLAAKDIPLPSLEGFIRQVIGWREFVKGIDSEYATNRLDQANFFGHTRTLKPCWYSGETGLLPLDHVIFGLNETGYAHHIERLMVCGAAMLMAEVEPGAAYNWFMEMFIDSADWVMGPNVFGMSQFSDGGLFATKPYLSGSAYLRRMSDYPPGPWCEVWDGLYWRFLHRNREKFAGNQRMAMMLRNLEKMDSSKLSVHYQNAEAFIDRTTSLPA